MTYRGQVKNGVIRLNGKRKLPEGTQVSVRPLQPKPAPKPRKKAPRTPTLYEQLKSVIGSLSLPADFSEQHDHYIHGTPKRPVQRSPRREPKRPSHAPKQR